MHIPTCETTAMELVRFDSALEAANAPSPNYDVSRWLYVPIFTLSTATFWVRGVKSLSSASASTPPLLRRTIWTIL